MANSVRSRTTYNIIHGVTSEKNSTYLDIIRKQETFNRQYGYQPYDEIKKNHLAQINGYKKAEPAAEKFWAKKILKLKI